jgi:hypothetical protein
MTRQLRLRRRGFALDRLPRVLAGESRRCGPQGCRDQVSAKYESLSRSTCAPLTEIPPVYAEKAEQDASHSALIFNCTQRAHQNTLESLPLTMATCVVWHTAVVSQAYMLLMVLQNSDRWSYYACHRCIVVWHLCARSCLLPPRLLHLFQCVLKLTTYGIQATSLGTHPR